MQSLSGAVRLKAETGSAFSGLVKNYHQITALFLAERPAWIRLVGQAPVVGTDIFDMASNGKIFHMYIPSKRRFLVGPAKGGKVAKNGIENLRPQPLFEALIWRKIPPGDPVLIEQEEQTQPPARYYVLTVLRRGGQGLSIDRRIWFDRANLRVTRIETFGSGGQIDSDVLYGDWREKPGTQPFPWRITLWQPRRDYRLEISVTRLTLNPPIPNGRFTLKQPPGTKLVEVGRGGGQP